MNIKSYNSLDDYLKSLEKEPTIDNLTIDNLTIDDLKTPWKMEPVSKTDGRIMIISSTDLTLIVLSDSGFDVLIAEKVLKCVNNYDKLFLTFEKLISILKDKLISTQQQACEELINACNLQIEIRE